MVVDDDFDIATLVKVTLQHNGFQNVFSFTKPSLALEHFRTNYRDYRLAIVDIRMPDINGFELAESIIKIKPDIKIQLMTAFDVNDNVLASMNGKFKSNISGVIQKPISPHKLASIIAAQIKK